MKKKLGLAILPVLLSVAMSVTTCSPTPPDVPAEPGVETRENLLSFGITGSAKMFPEKLNPSFVLRHSEVQKLLLDLAHAPMSAEEIDAALDESPITREDLETILFIRQEQARYVINFTLLTREDLARVSAVSDKYGNSLASAYVANRDRINGILSDYSLEGVDPKAAAYILLGCFSLDWDGLDLTAEKGYRALGTLRPGGSIYTPWAKERGDVSLKALYWGSHNDYHSDFVLTTFGDHDALPRNGFPDLLWRTSGALSDMNIPDGFRVPWLKLTRHALSELALPVGQVMMALGGGGKSAADLAVMSGLETEELEDLLHTLEHLQYIEKVGGRYRADIPVFSQQDAPMIEELLDVSRAVMEEWLADNHDTIRSELGEITPLRYGVPYEVVFTQIWHYIFGLTNRHLVEAGLFADPYGDGRTNKGFLPAVWHPSLSGDSPH